MKRINHLFEKICTIENFREAYKKATKGKKHYKEVVEIEKDVEGCLNKLLEEVQTLTYRTSDYYIFKLVTGGKEREVYKLPMRDRIVQHAIMNHIEPIFRKSFIVDTFSSIKGRGIHRGLKRLHKALKDVDNTKYCLKLDIKKFYPSINQNLLINCIERKFKDKNLLTLLKEIITSCDKGVPIGNYTSQYFANFFLTPMDHWIKEELAVKHYFRYCDDIVVLGPSKQYLKLLLQNISEYLKSVGLELKTNWQVFPVDVRSVDFLGFKSYHTHTLVRKYIKQNFKRKLVRNDKSTVLGSYWGIFCHANCTNLWEKYTGVKTFNDLRQQTSQEFKL